MCICDAYMVRRRSRLQRVTLNLWRDDVEAVRAIARELREGYQGVLRRWIHERAAQERATEKTHVL